MNKTELKIVCVLKTGGDFDLSYVERLFKAVSKHSTVEFRFVCFTDALAPRGMNKQIQIIELVNNWPTWWSKVEIFNLPGPVVYFDLDTVIVGNIDDLLRSVDVEEERFIMRKNPHQGNMSSNVMAWNGDYGWLVDRLLMNRPNAFKSKGKAIGLIEKNQFFRGDQDWIAHTLKQQKKKILRAQKYQVGIYSYKNEILSEHDPTDDPRIIVFHGYPRPSEVQNPPDWLIENWFALSTSSIPILNKPKLEKPTVSSDCVARTLIKKNRARRRMRQKPDTKIKEWRPKRRGDFQLVPKIWDSATCYILGGGPSLANVDVSLLNGKHVIAVNNAYRLAYFSEVLFWGDCWWFEQHRQHLVQFPGIMITTCEYEIDLPRKVMHIRHRLNRFGLSPTRLLTWNLNAGACAVNLAVQLGATTIVLLGYDMRQIDRRNNWHSDHRTSLDPNWNPYKEFLLAWPYIAHDAQEMGIQIINATPGSAIDMFPIVDPQELMGDANAVIDDSLCA